MQKSPLDSAYNRLDEAHRAWHTALEGYHRIEDFRAGINTAIQALRNITFALQKQKDQLQNFDTWYTGWQIKMGADIVLKALHAARTEIVHQEDLKLHSTATARTKGWVDFQKMVFTFDPMKDSHSLAKGFYDVYVRHSPVVEEIKHRLVFEFERRWVYDKLPDYELLEAIAHAYHFFRKMLSDAERQFSLPERENFGINDLCEAELNDKDTLRCMVLTPQERCLTYSFKDGKALGGWRMQTITRNEADLGRVHKKYGDVWKSEETLALLEGVFSNEHPYDQMKIFTQVAISSLRKDKYLVPVSFIFKKKDKVPLVISHVFLNQEQKVMAIDKIASEIVKNNAEYVVFVSEVWHYSLKDGKRKVPPTQGDTKGTRESIQVALVSADKVKIVGIPFRKNIFGKVIISKAGVEDYSANERHPHYIFDPLVRALKQVSGKP